MGLEKDIQLELMEHRFINCERLLLRPVLLEDAADLYEYAADEENTRHVFDCHKNIEHTKHTIAHFFMANPAGKYAIEHRDLKKMIGTVDIRVLEEHQIAELGYVLNQKFWGKGYMTEAATALMDLGFKTLGLEKIFAIHDVDNPASGKVMLRLGMQKEGVLRHHRIHKGKSIDMAYYGILREEYFRNQLND